MMIDQPAVSVQEMAEAAQARAAYNSFINLHFVTLVDQAFVTRLRNGELSSALQALAQDEAADEDTRRGAGLMLAYLEGATQMDLAQLTQNLGVDRTRLYRGVAKGYGPPPPNEVVWSKDSSDTSGLQAIVRVYKEAGLEPSPDVKERQDYISVELDFLRELALAEARAWEAGDRQAALGWFENQRAFLREHLAAWAPYFIEKAFEFVQTDFYRGHLLMLRGFIHGEGQRLEEIAAELASASV